MVNAILFYYNKYRTACLLLFVASPPYIFHIYMRNMFDGDVMMVRDRRLKTYI